MCVESHSLVYVLGTAPCSASMSPAPGMLAELMNAAGSDCLLLPCVSHAAMEVVSSLFPSSRLATWPCIVLLNHYIP